MDSESTVITDENYREQLGGATGVVLFYKKLCPNCKALEKMLDKFFASNPGIEYWRIDSEDCPEAMKDYGVKLVPTVTVIKEGKIAAQKVGLMNIREMAEFYRLS